MTAPDSAAVRDLFTRMDAAQLELWQFKLQPDVSSDKFEAPTHEDSKTRYDAL